ncbi:hypothetical protein PGQ11_010953 [Apiospora arundinis]|uniref:Uncharacterized protein n=1 Tax=Apiospora arundinis TaxID=335852 RepID=A0ABR2HY33_9PEZI
MRTSNSLLFLSFSAAGTSAVSSHIPPQHGHIAPTCATMALRLEHTLAFQDHFPSKITATPVEVTSTSAVSPSASPTGWNPQPSTADENTRTLLLSSLENARRRNQAKKCEDIEPDEFVEKATTFLSYWNTESAAQHDINEKAILERLTEYQIIYEAMNTLYMQDAFPDYILDQVRSVHQLVQEDGALTGANPRIIYGLDIVFNDICADTCEAQIPHCLQELVDVTLRGLVIDPQLQLLPPERECECECECEGRSSCKMDVLLAWNKESTRWECNCNYICIMDG